MIENLRFSSEIDVAGRKIGLPHPTYFIADIAANHNGDLEKAKALIYLAKEAGADAAKFQHFRAEKIVSDYGFRNMGLQQSHQAGWKKSVFQVYQEASIPWDWTPVLAETCRQVGIHFFSAPYDLEAIDMLDKFMPAYKVGSGDITWHEALVKMAAKKKPVFLATGASDMGEVEAAVRVMAEVNTSLCLMQCNTNYTGSLENFRFVQLNVLRAYARVFPGIVLGLSDHTPGHTTVLGAVTLGARAIEKHFTDRKDQVGPDHGFSMDPKDWECMVERVRELENALGDGIKKVEGNEKETVFIQRRCCRAARDLKKGEILTGEVIDVLRPVASGAYLPNERSQLIGKPLQVAMVRGEPFLKGISII